MTTTTTDRTAPTSESLTAERDAKQQRRNELAERLATVKADAAELRDKRARALADGGKVADRGKLAELADEQDAIERAIEHVDADLEEINARLHRAAATETEAVAIEQFSAATHAADAFEAMICDVVLEQILPAYQRLLDVVGSAREAESAHAGAAQRAKIDTEVSRYPRVERILSHRQTTVGLVHALQKFVNDRNNDRQAEAANR